MEVFNLFRDDLMSEETPVRVNAMRRLPLVAFALADKNQPRELLLNLIKQIANENEEDEILFGLAEGLIKLVPMFKTQMLPVLEKLTTVEETVVREKAVEALIYLHNAVAKSEGQPAVVATVNKLATSDSVLAKISALNTIAAIYPQLSELDKRSLLDKVNGMFTDDSLMLKRALASKLGTMCHFMPKEVLLTDIFTHFKTLGSDDSDQVKMLTIESFVKLAKMFNVEENKNHIVPFIIQMTSDKSWKVKHHLAKEFAELVNALGPDITDNFLISIFSTLLRDPENEVRIQAIRSLKLFVRNLSSEKQNTILAYLSGLSKDTVPLVRVGTCEVLFAITDDYNPNGPQELVKTQKETFKNRVQPILIDLLADKEVEVKIESVKLLKNAVKYQREGILDSITNGQYHLDLENPNWRIRYATYDALFSICKDLKKGAIFESHFKKYFNSATRDRAFSVRNLAITSISTNFAEYIEQPTISALLKEFNKNVSNTRDFYIYRITALYGMEALLAISEDKEIVKDCIGKLINEWIEDTVPNVRQVVVFVLNNLISTNKFADQKKFAFVAFKKLEAKEIDKEIKQILSKIQVN